MTTSSLAVSVVKDNLHSVFEEPDATKRRAAIERLWVQSSDAVFVDPGHVWRGHDGIDQCVAALVEKFKGWVFAEIGSPQVLPESGPDGGLQVVRLDWGYGLPGEEPKVKGQDVATIVDERMKMLVAILAPIEGS
ncbi:hypothetical protein LTR09_009108 [Extremus antarcticus]|uniref:SnoaL-like domain-containing protein n=1 Tax=Extremus antarcticus TaxID=702011 RepID=A0AAJ0G9K9_9PEZI|nr:hypothetical protein LTR09_009108 [Extremus antarcticus]